MSWGALLFHAALIVLLVLKKLVYCILINTSSSEYSVLYFIEHSKRCIPVCPPPGLHLHFRHRLESKYLGHRPPVICQVWLVRRRDSLHRADDQADGVSVLNTSLIGLRICNWQVTQKCISHSIPYKTAYLQTLEYVTGDIEGHRDRHLWFARMT